MTSGSEIVRAWSGALAARSMDEVSVEGANDNGAWADDGAGGIGRSSPMSCNAVFFIR
jgi:hypothetical protein